MSQSELPKQYNPKKVEDKWYSYWMRGKLFTPRLTDHKPFYSMVIPPPNVTDILHLGHGLNNTLQDILIRWKRMQGYETEWLPGIDHAGIATQVVIEKNLAKEGKTRQQIGREAFLKLAWEWKDKNGESILNQLKKIGCSCDWERTRFTLDEGFSEAVLTVFIHLYKKGLIYRGKYIINWCPKCLTSLSDDETERKEEDGNLWYIKYKIKGKDDYLTVATTRPETMLGDTAVAVSPKDKRYKKLIGKFAILPILDRELPIIADDLVDPEFGTGAVKVTPAHDLNDFEMGNRHNLERIVVINPDGKMNENAGKFAGMDRYKCRKALVAELKKKKLLEKTEPYKIPLSLCYRCDTTIEPYLSEQWFVKMKPLAEPAIRAVKDGTVKFHPEHWSKVYLNWMENIRDWCISRQLWWGHRIPVWYCLDCNEIIVEKTPPEQCPKCKSRNLKQDEDVLDTWFSSWLWPFSTFGWPEKTEDLKTFYPTKALFTGPDIIFLWVARMVMAGLEFMGEVPFYDVYIHGLVRDSNGIKMSKSLGNGIDPLEIIGKYGTDALRLSMILVTPEGQDPCISFNTFEIGRNFANKLWNAFRFIWMNLNGYKPEIGKILLPEKGNLRWEDRWILSRLNKTIDEVTRQMENYRFNSATKILYDFVWHDFCDWYIEMSKVIFRLPEDDSGKTNSINTTLFLWDNILRLLHPFIPFVTEEIWQNLYSLSPDDFENSLMKAPWPKSDPSLWDPDIERSMDLVQEVVVSVRNIRSEMNIPPSKKLSAYFKAEKKDTQKLLEENREHILTLGRIENLEIGLKLKKPASSATAVAKDFEIYIPVEGLIDVEQEKKRLEKEINRLKDLLVGVERKLANEDFLKKAPPAVVQKEKAKKQDYQKVIERLEKNLEGLVGW